MFNNLKFKVAIWAVSSGFPSVRLAPRGRFTRARMYAGATAGGGLLSYSVNFCGPLMVRWVPVSRWAGPVGPYLNSIAFKWLYQ